MPTSVIVDADTISRLRDAPGREPDAFRSTLSSHIGGEEPAYAEFRVSIVLDSHIVELDRGDEAHLTLCDANEPALTKLDRRVLDALDSHALWLSAWEVAERARTDDVGEVRRILRGLVHLHYATSMNHGHRQRWCRPSWARQVNTGPDEGLRP